MQKEEKKDHKEKVKGMNDIVAKGNRRINIDYSHCSKGRKREKGEKDHKQGRLEARFIRRASKKIVFILFFIRLTYFISPKWGSIQTHAHTFAHKKNAAIQEILPPMPSFPSSASAEHFIHTSLLRLVLVREVTASSLTMFEQSVSCGGLGIFVQCKFPSKQTQWQG